MARSRIQRSERRRKRVSSHAGNAPVTGLRQQWTTAVSTRSAQCKRHGISRSDYYLVTSSPVCFYILLRAALELFYTGPPHEREIFVLGAKEVVMVVTTRKLRFH